MNRLKVLLLIILLPFLSFPASSHQISQSFSNWTVEEKNVTAIFSIAPRYITLLPVLDGYYDSLEEQLSNHLKILWFQCQIVWNVKRKRGWGPRGAKSRPSP